MFGGYANYCWSRPPGHSYVTFGTLHAPATPLVCIGYLRLAWSVLVPVRGLVLMFCPLLDVHLCHIVPFFMRIFVNLNRWSRGTLVKGSQFILPLSPRFKMKLFVPTRQKITGGSGTLCMDRRRFQNLYVAPKKKIIRTVETNTLLAGQTPRMGKIKNAYKMNDLTIWRQEPSVRPGSKLEGIIKIEGKNKVWIKYLQRIKVQSI